MTATFQDGSTLDVTNLAEVRIEPSTIANYESECILPLQDGSGQLEISYAGFRSTIPLHIENTKSHPPIEFRNEVLQALTKAGCNTGKCHGSASGKDGFRLSLFGYDPEGDHFRLTRELSGRRIQLARAEQSL